jgi:DNA repair exonuclease SbcCD nuclease subunit
MKILFIGDPHIKNDNHYEIDILLSLLKNINKIEKFDRIIIGGDLMHYHERIYTQALNKTIEFITELSILCPLDILVGNHDMINNQQFLTSNHWLNFLCQYKNVFVIDKPTIRNFDNVSLILCPYVYPGRFIEALETVEKNWKNYDVIFAHQEFKGCKMGSIISTEGDEWDNGYPQIISGHIHDNQQVNTNIYYPGSPLQHAFGDTDKRVVCVYENKNIRDIILDVPKKIMIKSTINDLDINLLSLDSSTKLKLKATSEEFKLFKKTKEYKECIDKGVKIQIDKKYDIITKNNYKKDINSKSFGLILNELVLLEKDSLLKKIYNEIMNL